MKTDIVWTTSLFLLGSLLLGPIEKADAASFRVLYAFQGNPDGADPTGRLLLDKTGALYGIAGGGKNCGGYEYGCGTVFKINADGTENTLHLFSKHDGHFPTSLVRDGNGRLFGTTNYGGAWNWGTVFDLSHDGKEKVLYSFNGSNGYNPEGLSRDRDGNLYGESFYAGGCCGLVFKITPGGDESTLYTFRGGSDGANPAAGLIKDRAGNFYGTTFFGGGGTVCTWNPPSGCGTVYKLTPDGTETVLYAFSGGGDGANPQARLSSDKDGNLYGTTYFGGAYGYGVVFRLTPEGKETVLHSFTGGADGGYPGRVQFIGKFDKLYGTTVSGGETACASAGCGVIFTVTLDGTFEVLHTFTGGSDGALPLGELTKDTFGNLYGTAALGGVTNCDEGCGTVFKLKP